MGWQFWCQGRCSSYVPQASAEPSAGMQVLLWVGVHTLAGVYMVYIWCYIWVLRLSRSGGVLAGPQDGFATPWHVLEGWRGHDTDYIACFLAPIFKHCMILIHGLPRTQLLALVGIRKGLECIFSLHDLSWLDSLLPDTAGKEAEGKQSRRQKVGECHGEEVSDVLGAVLLHQPVPEMLGCGGWPWPELRLLWAWN